MNSSHTKRATEAPTKPCNLSNIQIAYFVTSTIITIALIAIGLLSKYEIIKGISSSGLLYSGISVGTIEILAIIIKLWKTRKLPSNYKLLSWNTGTDEDFRTQNKVKNSTAEKERKLLLESAFQQMEADILFLQEAGDQYEYIQTLLPKYAFVADRKRFPDTVLAWNTNKFRMLEQGVFEHDRMGSAYALLEDRQTHTTILASSAHIVGFNLATKAEADQGNSQLRALGTDIGGKRADLVLIGMDANADWNHYPERLDILRKLGFSYDLTHRTATYMDTNLNSPVTLDHFAAKVQKGTIAWKSTPTPDILKYDKTTTNPSDHSPVLTTITVS